MAAGPGLAARLELRIHPLQARRRLPARVTDPGVAGALAHLHPEAVHAGQVGHRDVVREDAVGHGDLVFELTTLLRTPKKT